MFALDHRLSPLRVAVAAAGVLLSALGRARASCIFVVLFLFLRLRVVFASATLLIVSVIDVWHRPPGRWAPGTATRLDGNSKARRRHARSWSLVL